MKKHYLFLFVIIFLLSLFADFYIRPLIATPTFFFTTYFGKALGNAIEGSLELMFGFIFQPFFGLLEDYSSYDSQRFGGPFGILPDSKILKTALQLLWLAFSAAIFSYFITIVNRGNKRLKKHIGLIIGSAIVWFISFSVVYSMAFSGGSNDPTEMRIVAFFRTMYSYLSFIGYAAVLSLIFMYVVKFIKSFTVTKKETDFLDQ